MENSNEKKKRAPNFSANERYLLLNCIIKYKNVIENKKTDSNTWKEKDETWQKIAEQFNSQSTETHHRSKDSLRKYYDNIKKNVRKEVAEERKELNATGGGVKRKKCNDETMQLALAVMNKKTLYGFENPFDGDATISKSQDVNEVAADMSPNPSFKHCYSINENMIDGEPSTSRVSREQLKPHPLKEKNHNETSEPSTSGVGKSNWAKCSTSKLKQPAANNMGQTWFKRRRPPLRTSSASEEKYSAIAKIKNEIYTLQQHQIMDQESREKELFELKKKTSRNPNKRTGVGKVEKFQC